MPEDATVRDLIVAVRADEASHSHVNHTLSSMGTRQSNPFHVGHTELPENFVEPPRVSSRSTVDESARLGSVRSASHKMHCLAITPRASSLFNYSSSSISRVFHN